MFSPLLLRWTLDGLLKNSIYLNVLHDSRNECPNANVLPLPQEKIRWRLVRIKVWIAPQATYSTFSDGLKRNNSMLSFSSQKLTMELTVPPTLPVGRPSTRLDVRSTDFEGLSSL